MASDLLQKVADSKLGQAAINTVTNLTAKAGAKAASSKNTVDLRSSGSSDTGGGWIGRGSPSTVQVNPDGTAPSGLSAGTLVNTAGGVYRIDSVNPDGTYNSSKLGGNIITPNGGTASGGSMRSGSLYTIDDILNNRRANLMGLGIGDMYGITYDQDKLLKVYNQATDAQYALKQKEQQIAENKYYQNLYNTQNSTIDALRAQRNSQIASGMSAGLAAAADSATAMGIQQEGAAGALELANARQTMADEIAAAYAQNIVSALQDSNTLRAQIAGLDLNKYGYDTNFDAAFAGAVPLFNEAYANMYQADLGLQGLREQIASNEAIAAADREAQKYYGGGNGYTPYTSPNPTNVTEDTTPEDWLNQFRKADGTYDTTQIRLVLATNGDTSTTDIDKIIKELEKENKDILSGNKQKGASIGDALKTHLQWQLSIWKKAYDLDKKVKQGIAGGIKQIGQDIITHEKNGANNIMSFLNDPTAALSTVDKDVRRWVYNTFGYGSNPDKTIGYTPYKGPNW